MEGRATTREEPKQRGFFNFCQSKQLWRHCSFIYWDSICIYLGKKSSNAKKDKQAKWTKKHLILYFKVFPQANPIFPLVFNLAHILANSYGHSFSIHWTFIRCKHYTGYRGDNGPAFEVIWDHNQKKNYKANLKAKPQFTSLPRSQSYFHGVIGMEINVSATSKLSFSVILMICRTVRREGNDQEQQHSWTTILMHTLQANMENSANVLSAIREPCQPDQNQPLPTSSPKINIMGKH